MRVKSWVAATLEHIRETPRPNPPRRERELFEDPDRAGIRPLSDNGLLIIWQHPRQQFGIGGNDGLQAERTGPHQHLCPQCGTLAPVVRGPPGPAHLRRQGGARRLHDRRHEQLPRDSAGGGRRGRPRPAEGAGRPQSHGLVHGEPGRPQRAVLPHQGAGTSPSSRCRTTATPSAFTSATRTETA